MLLSQYSVALSLFTAFQIVSVPEPSGLAPVAKETELESSNCKTKYWKTCTTWCKKSYTCNINTTVAKAISKKIKRNIAR